MPDYLWWFLIPVAIFLLWYLFTNSIRKSIKRVSSELGVSRQIVRDTLYSLNKPYQRGFTKNYDYRTLSEIIFARELMVRIANPDFASLNSLGFLFGTLEKNGYPPCDPEGKNYIFPDYAYARPTEEPYDIEFFKTAVKNIFETDDFIKGKKTATKIYKNGKV